METTLRLYTYIDGKNDTPFPDSESYVGINSFEYNADRMGGAPTITATIKHKKCLDGLWSDKVYAEFMGEKFFVMNTPSSSKSNEDARYTHQLELLSEREVLNHVYFIDAVQGDSDVDVYKSNSTSVHFFGDISEFVSRLNSCLSYANLDYTAVIDEGVTSEAKEVSFDDKYILEALQEIFNIYEIPYYFAGKVIHIGYTENVVTYPLKYGFDGALLSISKENANYAIINKIKGQGSSDNIPYYYPNETAKGSISLSYGADNTRLKEGDVKIDDAVKFSKVNVDSPISYEDAYIKVTGSQYKKDDGEFSGYDPSSRSFTVSANSVANYTFKHDIEKNFTGTVSVIVSFHSGGEEAFDSSMVTSAYIETDGGMVYNNADLSGRNYVYFDIPTDKVSFNITFKVTNNSGGTYAFTHSITTSHASYGIWRYNGGQVKLSDIGLSLSSGASPSSGDYVSQKIDGYIQPMGALMPPIYRESNGEEQFYEAKNNTYPDGEGGYYEFENEYSDNNQREGTTDFEDIKPTIVGITNASGQRIDMFTEFAYDEDDNDETDDEGNYLHPYFFAKLRKFDGENGFNLFDHAIESQTMQFSFTSGVCGACTFELGVGKGTDKNIVQVDDNGNLKRDEDGNVLWENQTPQDRQNDTRNYEVWIALKKEDSTYGQIMPNKSQNLRPSTNDTFVILGINLPMAYITAAEEKLKQSLIKYMWENNRGKFTFSVSFSRIFFAEHPDVLAQLNENSRVLIEYNEQQYALYVESFSYKVEENTSLPEIQITLADTITVGQNSLQTQLDAVKQDILSAFGGGDFLKQGLKYFLRKDVRDYAQKLITFYGGANFGQFIKSLTTGKGAGIDADGNAEFESIRVRSYMEVLELIVNRQSALEGDQILTESDTIESVEGLGGNTYRLNLRRKWDGYFTAQAENNVLRGIINTLNAGSGDYYTSWMRVNSVNAANNSIEVTLYPDSETPAQKNFPPCEMMKIARWGNQTDTKRQSCLYLSSTEGRIVKLVGVTKPIIDKTNYGACLGTVPEFLNDLDLPLREGRDYMYVPGIITTDMIRIDYQGQPIYEVVDRGKWSADEEYYSKDLNPVTNIYEISDVWYMGCKYRCQKTGTKTAPAWNNTDWAMVEGNPAFTVDFEQTDYLFDPDRFALTLTIIAYLYNMDITDDILDADVEWTRYSEDANGVERVASDNAWALKHVGAGKSIDLTVEDCDFNGYVPKVLKFIATVTLRDGMGNEAGTANAVFRY